MDKPVLCSEQMPLAKQPVLGFFPKSQCWMTLRWYPLESDTWLSNVWLAPDGTWHVKESVSHWVPGPVVSQAEDTALRERVAAVTKERDAALISRAFYEDLNTVQTSLRLGEERDEAIRERDEARAQLEARDRIAREERQRWDSDPLCKQLDHHRQKIGGMLPSDACFIADMQSRMLRAEAERDEARADADRRARESEEWHQSYSVGRPEVTSGMFTAAQKEAGSWRCWDRTESQRTEDRIIDGATWGILYAIQDGRIPGIAITPRGLPGTPDA